LEIEIIKYIDQDHHDELLERLLGTIFHVTSKENFEQIKKDKYIGHNRDKRYKLNTSSEGSFGRKKGWVCLFDLREESKETIEETMFGYNFLGPNWFYTQNNSDSEEANLVYLFFCLDEYQRLIPNVVGREELTKSRKGGLIIPKTECWFPGDLSLKHIRHALFVKVIRKLDDFEKAVREAHKS